MTKPRSEVVSEAQNQGLEVKSPDQERDTFYELERKQQDEIVELIRRRTDASVRDPNYRLGPSDEIEINVFDVPEMNVTARVRESGYVSLPLVGAVKAGGLTEQEFHEELRKRLASYVKNPELTVFVSLYGSQKVAVLGAVAKPGSYPLKKGSNSILELLSEAGGVNDRAGGLVTFVPAERTGLGSSNDVEARARLALNSQGGLDVRNSGIQLYLDQVLGTNGLIPLEIPVRGGDMIVVPEAGKINVDGEVQKPGAYELGQRMTLLGALAAAGGITYGAKVDEVEVIREVGLDDKAHLVVDLSRLARGEDRDVRLRNGDIVVVPSDSGRRLTQDTFEGISKVFNFGIGGSVNLANP
ncbi:MAG: polysaccharide export protein [Oligoflexia bacterium]|nr:polysaccharide export protein [Oligoflexia bacterium]